MKIAFIVPYFGKWPVWFPAFLKSCEYNPTIQWIFFSDCEAPEKKPKNVDFYGSNLQDIKSLATTKMGFEVALNDPKKLCDLKPAYGDLFSNYLIDYDFWGFCDIDIIWGDIRKFITQDKLDNFDIITTLDKMISGHFTIFNNTAEAKLFYKHSGTYINCFQNPKHVKFDEIHFSQIITELTQLNEVKVFWDKQKIVKGIESPAHQEYYLDKWQWNNGKIFEIYGKAVIKEYMYLHFINWKKTMKKCEVKFTDLADYFYISYSSIHFKLHSDFEKGFITFKNLFIGYFVREKKRIFIKRLKKKLKWL
ncbi:hypothetical protein D3C85_415430 [compost metagenome]